MSKRTQHFLSVLLTVVLLINLLPVGALAENVDDLDNAPSANTGDLEDVYIIGEVTENCSEFSKEYVLSNGLHMAAVYGEPVHYEENGAWKEIDNTLRASGSGANAVYTNTAGAWEVSFPHSFLETVLFRLQKMVTHFVLLWREKYTLPRMLVLRLHQRVSLLKKAPLCFRMQRQFPRRSKSLT